MAEVSHEDQKIASLVLRWGTAALKVLQSPPGSQPLQGSPAFEQKRREIAREVADRIAQSQAAVLSGQALGDVKFDAGDHILALDQVPQREDD